MVNEGNVDIQKFPASKVHQLAKKMESSKATAKHIRQVAGDIPAAQVQLMHHPTYPTSCQELSQKEIKLNIWPETAKLQDTGSSHNVESTQHAETRCSLQ